MNYYLTPREIAEALGLAGLRKSSPGGFYLLSESDLVPYGIERAKEAGAVELSNNRHVSPSHEAEEAQAPVQQSGDNASEDSGAQVSGQDAEQEPAQADDAQQEESVAEDNNNENTEEE